MSPDAIFGHPFLDVLLPRFEECLRDVDGRPLGEGNAPAGARSAVPFSFRKCPYPGSRRGGLMNASALAPMGGAAWDEILALLAVLRAAFLARYPVAMNYLLLSRMAVFLTLFGGWLIRTRRTSWDAIPRPVSGLFKAAQGLYFTANDAMIHGGVESAFAPVTVDAFLLRTETRNIFRVGDRVCAGPPEMVRQFARAAIEGGAADSQADGFDLSPAELAAAADYSELRLRAQQADRVRILMIEAALARARGEESRDDTKPLLALDRQCGLGATAAALPVPSGIDGALEQLIRPGAPQPAALRCAREILALLLHHASYAIALQRRIDIALGRPNAARFDHESHLELLGAFGPDPALAEADRLFDVAALAALMSRLPAQGAAAPATSRHR